VEEKIVAQLRMGRNNMGGSYHKFRGVSPQKAKFQIAGKGLGSWRIRKRSQYNRLAREPVKPGTIGGQGKDPYSTR